MTKDHRQDWDNYWDGAQGVGVFGQFTVGEDVLREFWSRFFEDVFAGEPPARILDLACGSGAVTAMGLRAARELSAHAPVHVCVDFSVPAVMALKARGPQALPVAADARAAPFADASFDIVASQFGLEYAGADAFTEAARLMAPGGRFAALCHLGGGEIHKECLDNLDTIQSVLECRFLPLASAAFSAAFALDRGLGTAQAAEDTARALAGANAAMKALVGAKGMGAANGLPARLFRDMGQLAAQRRAYAPQDIFHWIEAMTGELEAYAGRMRSMTGAALGESAVRDIGQAMAGAGLDVDEPGTLVLKEGGGPAAWILTARRPSA